VAAWVAVRILAEKDAAPPWGLPSETTLEWLRCETDQPVDDLLVGTSANGLVFGQVKRTLQLSETADSDLASTFDQFVRQHVAYRGKTTAAETWGRTLDPTRDRLVLITSPSSSKPVRLHLSSVLRRLGRLLGGQPLEHAATNDEERRALSIVREHVTRSWQKALGVAPLEEEAREIK
jgi:hypothetical protein